MRLCRLFFTLRSSGIFARRQTFMTPSCCCFTSPQKQLEEYLLIQSRGLLEFYMNNMACRSWRTMSHGGVGFHSNHIHFKPLRHSSSLWGAALAWPWHAFSASICGRYADRLRSEHRLYVYLFFFFLLILPAEEGKQGCLEIFLCLQIFKKVTEWILPFSLFSLFLSNSQFIVLKEASSSLKVNSFSLKKNIVRKNEGILYLGLLQYKKSATWLGSFQASLAP